MTNCDGRKAERLATKLEVCLVAEAYEDTIEGRLARLEQLLTTVAEQQLALLAKLDEPAVAYLDVTGAGIYLGLSPRGVRVAEKKGLIRSHRTANNRVLFKREDLDRFATANDHGQ